MSELETSLQQFGEFVQKNQVVRRAASGETPTTRPVMAGAPRH